MHASTAAERPRDAFIALVAVACLASAACALFALTGYKNTPGDEGDTPARWPAATSLTLDPVRPTLVVFVHARCPCTRATVAELAGLVDDVGARVSVQIVADEPDAGTASLTRARAIAGVDVRGDHGGVEAHRFGALTSGYTVLYASDGTLLFHGGITAERGHVGANPGRDAVERLVRDGSGARMHTPTFGCAIFNRPQGAT